MRAENKTELLSVVAKVQADLRPVARSSEKGIDSALHTFRSLAGQADAILKRAASIVACVESESVNQVLPAVQSLCLTLSAFLEQKLKAASSILESLQQEEELLSQLARITHRQSAISSHLGALSVLTNVEVAQLGSAGGDFLILAQELASFSKSITAQTVELASHAENRNQSVGDSRQELAATVPQLRGELIRMEASIGENLEVISAGIGQLSRIPAQFRSYAQETSGQIAGVVAAIQSHDITRQQIEHVQDSLDIISSRITSAESSGRDELPLAYAGLIIQVYQLKNIKQTIAGWTSQVGGCMDGIRRLSVSELVSIGPAVLKQERNLTVHLAQIDALQKKSQEYTKRIEKTLEGLSGLLELINEHLERSRSIRHRLQLLTFNSLIEANRLGLKGVVVSAIANLIKEVSVDWSAIAEQSKSTLNKITQLVNETNEVMEVFAESRGQKLREDHEKSSAALNNVRAAAEFVASESERMRIVMEKMQSDLAGVGDTGEQLQECFAPLDSALRQMETLTQEIASAESAMALAFDVAEAEKLFSACYTTEIERKVLLAALHGADLPVLAESLAGNDVELF